MKALQPHLVRNRFWDESTGPMHRRGAMLVLAFFTLVACMGFVAFTVDIGIISHTNTRMQNACDAAALAAVMEITHAIQNAGDDVESAASYAQAAAAAVAAQVMQMNGIYIDPNQDVEFGTRVYNPSTGTYEIQWGTSHANAVRVTARKDNPDRTAPDAKLNLFFAGFFGDDQVALTTNAAAFVESRDIVSVLDFSRSMNFDSYFNTQAGAFLSHQQIVNNLRMVWDDLQPVNLGSLNFDPVYLEILDGDGSGSDPLVQATFRFDKVDVTSTSELYAVKLTFTDWTTQVIQHPSGTSGTFQGSGQHAGKNLRRVEATVQITPADQTVSGQAASGCRPHVDVTFAGDALSVGVISTKDLSNVVLEFEDGTQYKFDDLNIGNSGTFAGIEQNLGKKIVRVWVKSGCNSSGAGPGYGEEFNSPVFGETWTKTVVFDDTNAMVMQTFGLDSIPYPYPLGSWNEYINFVRSNTGLRDAGYQEMYGGLTFVNYLLNSRCGHWETPDLWKTRHFPFYGVKEGQLLLCDFLESLNFGDRLGTVSYDTSHRFETMLNTPGFPYVNISNDPITTNFTAARDLIYYKQAGHYSYATNMGGGLKDAIQMLDDYRRQGARPAILLMTDGNTNTIDPGENTSLPAGWNWDQLFDYDGDGVRDYHTSSSQKRYVLRLAKQAIDRGYVIHTLSIGIDADWQLMEAIAHLGRGEHLRVQGGTSIEQMQNEIKAAYYRIASMVPPAQLLP